jgi:hypothetical protein
VEKFEFVITSISYLIEIFSNIKGNILQHRSFGRHKHRKFDGFSMEFRRLLEKLSWEDGFAEFDHHLQHVDLL